MPFPKGNVIAWLEFEVASFESAVLHFSYYASVIPHPILLKKDIFSVRVYVYLANPCPMSRMWHKVNF